MAALFCGCCGMESKEQEDANRIREYKRKSNQKLWDLKASLAMLEAARVGDLAKVKAEIDRGADINKAETEKGDPKYGRTALIWAIEYSKGVKLLEWLVSQPECDLNVFKFERGGVQKSALHSAVLEAGTRIGVDKVRILLSQPERIVIDPKALDHAKTLASMSGDIGTSYKSVIELIQAAQGHQDRVKAEEADKAANEAKVEEANKEVTEGAGSDVLTDGSVTLSASSQPVQPADPDEPKFEVPVLPGPNDELET